MDKSQTRPVARPKFLVVLTCAIFALLMFPRSLVADTDLFKFIDLKVQSDPFVVAFQRNMKHAFGCRRESDPQSQPVLVFASLTVPSAPTIHIDIYCHSALVDWVELDLDLWRGGVRKLSDFDEVNPDMIKRIRFRQSDSFAWYIAQRHSESLRVSDARAAAISTPIWAGFTAIVTEMYPQGCEPLDEESVFYQDAGEMILAGVPYKEFVSGFSCLKPGPRKPGFKLVGRHFLTKGFVLPVEIAAAGVYVD